MPGRKKRFSVLPHTGRQTRQARRAERGGFNHVWAFDRNAEDVRLKLHQPIVGRRTTVYTHAQRVVQAVASEQASGISYDALWQENERLKAENAALWQAWSEAESLSEAKQRDFAGSGCAMGLRLSQIVTL